MHATDWQTISKGKSVPLKGTEFLAIIENPELYCFKTVNSWHCFRVTKVFFSLELLGPVLLTQTDNSGKKNSTLPYLWTYWELSTIALSTTNFPMKIYSFLKLGCIFSLRLLTKYYHTKFCPTKSYSHLLQ